MSNIEKDTKYRVIKYLGSGSYSNVYKCKRNDGQIVAVKQIKYEDKTLDIEIRREIKSQSIMSHVNIVKFYRYIFGYNVTYIVMECCEDTLRNYLDKNKKLSNSKIRYILKSISEGLKYIHNLDYIHRDIKSRNILITNKGEIKIGDFGFCIHKNEVKIGRIAGTPNYLAPELIRDKKSRKEDDIWSMGIIIYNLHYDKLPWPRNISDNKSILYKYITSLKIKYYDESKITDLLRNILIFKESRFTLRDILNSSFLLEGSIKPIK